MLTGVRCRGPWTTHWNKGPELHFLSLGLAVLCLGCPESSQCPSEFVQKIRKSPAVKMVTSWFWAPGENCTCFLTCRMRALSPVMSKLPLKS